MRKVIGVGETILDIIFKNNQPQQAIPGGSVFNAFVSLGRLGVPLNFISELGNDKVGRIIAEFMEENNIPTNYVDHFPDGKTPVSLAFLDNQNEAEYVFYKDYPNQRLDAPLPRIEENDIFIFGSYYALNPVLREKILELLEYARERKAIIYYDPNFRNAHAHEAIRLRPTALENFEYADIVRGSDEDFRNLFGKTDIEHIYKEHVEFYCKNLIVTCADKGIELFTSTLREHFDTPSFAPVSTVGAGDNFNAGILFGLLRYNITKEEIPTLGKDVWNKIIRHGIVLAREVCSGYDNYISKVFASNYTKQS